ncbi:MAG: L-fuculose-phosphate aldolase [Oceanicoccus sp.]|jgi:L-fuculose-phosphate aldolase
MHEKNLRQQLIDQAQQLNNSGLSIGKSGNISVRCDQGLLITPTGMDYAKLQPEDIVLLSLEGELLTNKKTIKSQARLPSSEWHFHCGIYQTRIDVNAVVHAHPTYCSALACTGREIPAFHYMVAVAGGDNIPLAPYAIFGSEELSMHACHALQQRQACLLANHGMIAVGVKLDSAFNLALEIEGLAQQYCEALKLGDVVVLSTTEMQQVLAKFKDYGQRL